ncbi:MAG: kelch repeat-containing protein [Methylobacter sp.]|uniref:hypothetical protein n=1 Tax=Methylobacter sp. TaxID=2051955 RepID=UPI0025EB0EC0|nr:hypothetical protein [Methylobacter sp.]MCK9619126.1 kelch repeat-containing protein [Methylobacter sp.]
MSKFLWAQKSNFGPSPRAGHAMAFDSKRGRMVLFGGNSDAGGLIRSATPGNGMKHTGRN